MNETELRTAIQNCDMEIASMVSAQVEEIRTGKTTKDEAEKKVNELRAKKADLERQLAVMNAPQSNDKEERSFSKLAREAIEKRTAITLNGTGRTLSLAEIFKPAESKAPIASKVRYFYGPNANTNIPVLGGAPEFVAVDEGGVFADKSPTYGVKTVTPTGYGASIQISDYALKMTSGNLEAELRASLSDSMLNLVHKLIIDQAKGNDITQAVAGGLSVQGLRNLALAMRDKFDDGVIVLNSAVYSAIIATATDAADKVTIEGVIRDKEIEGVPVVFSALMPSATSAGSLLAVGGRWSDMAVGIADQVDITPKETAGSSVHTLDTICYAAAKCVVPANFWKLSVASE